MKVLFICCVYLVIFKFYSCWRFRWWRGDRIHGWVAVIASHGSGFLSRGGLDAVELPRHSSHPSSLHCDAVDNRTFSRLSKVSHLQSCFGIKMVTVISFFWFSSTALTELEELNLDRTLITDDGCTVLSCKYYLLSGEIVSLANSPYWSSSLSQTICSQAVRPNSTPYSSLQICGHVRLMSKDLFQLRLCNTISLHFVLGVCVVRRTHLFAPKTILFRIHYLLLDTA